MAFEFTIPGEQLLHSSVSVRGNEDTEDNLLKQDEESFYSATITECKLSGKTPVLASSYPIPTSGSKEHQSAMETESVVPEQIGPNELFVTNDKPNETHGSQLDAKQHKIGNGIVEDRLTISKARDNELMDVNDVSHDDHTTDGAVNEIKNDDKIPSGPVSLARMDESEKINDPIENNEEKCGLGDVGKETVFGEVAEYKSLVEDREKALSVISYNLTGQKAEYSQHTIDFATLVQRAGILPHGRHSNHEITEVEVSSQPLVEVDRAYDYQTTNKNTNLCSILRKKDSAAAVSRRDVTRSVHFGSPVVSVNFIMDESDDDESTTSTEILYSDEGELYQDTTNLELQMNDQEVPRTDEDHEPPSKRMKTYTTYSGWTPEFNFPKPINIPSLVVVESGECLERGSVSFPEKGEEVNESMCAHTELSELTMEAHEITTNQELCNIQSNGSDDLIGDTLRYASSTATDDQEVSSANDKKSVTMFPKQQICNLQTVPGSYGGLSRSSEHSLYLSVRMNVCPSILRLGEGALLEEVDSVFAVPTGITKEALLAQNFIQTERDSFYDATEADQLCEFTPTSAFAIREKPEDPLLSPTRGSQTPKEYKEQFFWYEKPVDDDSCCSEISDVVEDINDDVTSEYLDNKEQGERDDEQTDGCAPATGDPAGQATGELKGRAKRTAQILSDLKCSLDDLDGPELLEAAMHLVEGALKKAREPIVRNKLEASHESRQKPVLKTSAAFTWRNNLPYDSQHAVLNMNLGEAIVPKDSEQCSDDSFKDLKQSTFPKTPCARPLRLGLSRRRRVTSLHPYATRPDQTRKNAVTQDLRSTHVAED